MAKNAVTARRELSCFVLLAGMLALAGCSGSPASNFTSTTTQTPPPQNPIGSNLTQLSADPFTIAPGQHATEVEPHMLASGNTLVAAFQVGRISPGGATDIGWAISTNGGTTWAHGSLPGLTKGEGSGPYDAASDPVVAYDAKHAVWMIASLPISNTSLTPAVVVSRSTDGGHTWQSPVNIDPTAASSDKNWIVCDSWPNSPHYGNCYVEWDDPSNLNQIEMSTTSDGGLTWSPPAAASDFSEGIGGVPVVQPNGNVVVPLWLVSNNLGAFLSTDGGASWGASAIISNLQSHADAGGIRSGPLPSSAVDSAGNVWVLWEDCRFRANCSANDLVYSTSSDGVNWSAVTRVPIDAVTSTADYFIPGIGIDPATAGSSARVAIHYYYYPQTNCTFSTCQLDVGFISSTNGGASWNTPLTVAGPSQLSWLPASQNGWMVGDYIATVFTNGVPHGAFAVAAATSGSTFNEAIYTGQGLSVKASAKQLTSAGERPLHHLTEPMERENPEKGLMPPSRNRARRRSK
jgi:hypothetical protein